MTNGCSIYVVEVPIGNIATWPVRFSVFAGVRYTNVVGSILLTIDAFSLHDNPLVAGIAMRMLGQLARKPTLVTGVGMHVIGTFILTAREYLLVTGFGMLVLLETAHEGTAGHAQRGNHQGNRGGKHHNAAERCHEPSISTTIQLLLTLTLSTHNNSPLRILRRPNRRASGCKLLTHVLGRTHRA